MTTIKFKKLSPEAKLPEYKTPGAAGMDVCAVESAYLMPGQRVAVKTGLAVEIPAGWEIQVRPRSGLALKSGLTVLNTPGTVDSDFRGEVCVIVINHGSTDVFIAKGDRIAQFVVARAEQAEIEEVPELSDTSRGAGGFGSTGLT